MLRICLQCGVCSVTAFVNGVLFWFIGGVAFSHLNAPSLTAYGILLKICTVVGLPVGAAFGLMVGQRLIYDRTGFDARWVLTGFAASCAAMFVMLYFRFRAEETAVSGPIVTMLRGDGMIIALPVLAGVIATIASVVSGRRGIGLGVGSRV